MKRHLLTSLALSFILSSCGIRPGISSANKPLGQFASRTVFPNDLSGAYEFQDLVGAVVQLEKNGAAITAGLIRPEGYVTSVKTITEPNAFYKSRIDNKASAQGSYLSFAASIKVDQMYEIELTDAARAAITFPTTAPFEDIMKKATKWVADHPKTDPDIQRIWIKEVVLTTQLISTSTKIDANSKGDVGAIAKIEGGIFKSNEDAAKSIMLGLVSYDIDKLVAAGGAIAALSGDAVDQSLGISSFKNKYFTKAIVKKN